MWKLSSGGAIAVVSANRPVYIAENGPLVEAFGRHIFERDSEGRRLTLGEINKRAKNDYCTTDRNDKPVRVANSNKLRYVLLGDPSMRTVVPRNHVAVDSINGIDLQAYPDQAVLKANQNVTVKGHISDGHGSPIAGFNGTLNVTLYDAEQSLTTLGTGGDTGKKVTYDTHGDRLFEGYFPVKDGVFDINIPMPSEIANNFRPATMSLYAYPSADDSDAAGCESRLYVFGRDETAAPDTIAPVIETFYLNHSSFESGETVNSTPVAIAKVSDNRAINMSSAGVGHRDDTQARRQPHLHRCASVLHRLGRRLPIGHHRLSASRTHRRVPFAHAPCVGLPGQLGSRDYRLCGERRHGTHPL